MVSRKKTTVKVNVIGIGGCGNNLASKFKDVGKKFNPNILNINSSSTEMSVDSVNGIKTLVVGEGMGAARNPGKGSQIANANYADIVSFLEDNIEANADFTVNILMHSLAGGTGGGFVSSIITGLNEVFDDRNTEVINLDVAVLPFIFEANPANSNAIAALKMLYEDHILTQHASLVIIDNEKFKEHVGKGKGGYDDVNRIIVENFLKLLDYDYIVGKSKAGGLGTFDYSEFLRILQPQKPEGGIFNVYKYDVDSGDTESFVSDLPLQYTKRGIVVFRTKKSPSADILSDVQKKIGSFVIFKESDPLGNGKSAFLITNGTPLPTNLFNKRLNLAVKHANKILGKTGKDKKTFKKVKTNKLLDL